jgi:type III restriction enzyme
VKTGTRELDECWVFCLRKRAKEIMSEVKHALEQEGYEGDAASIVDRSGGVEERDEQTSLFRPEFRRLYKEFKGKVYLPRFCVKSGAGYEGLNYFDHLLSAVDVDRFDYGRIDWSLSDEMDRAKEHFFRVTLGQKNLESRGHEEVLEWEADERVRAWLVANLPFEHYSWRELGRVVDGVMGRLPSIKGKFGLVKYIVRDKLAGFVIEETNTQTAAQFHRLFHEKRLSFYLKCVECRFEIPQQITLRSTRRLVHEDNQPIERSLFDVVPEASMNEYEKEIALCMDRHPEVLWWYRNEVGKNSFSIQGWQPDKIFPDFVVQKGTDGRKPQPDPTVLVVEGKGEHLVGSADTTYKREVADFFTKVGKSVSWQELGKGFEKSTFRFQIVDQDEHGAWKDELKKLLGDE